MTISGPPRTLKQLFQTSSAFTSARAELPVYGPYHAPHLHRAVNVDKILGLTDPKTSTMLATYRLSLPLMSTSSGTCFDKSFNAPSLLAAVVHDILNESLKLQRMVSGCADRATAAGCRQCHIIPFGPSNSKSIFIKAMESETSLKPIINDHLAAGLSGRPTAFGDAPRTSKRTKIAIVGMAGRFPNAADHEKFWDLLEAGLDVHKKVCCPTSA